MKTIYIIESEYECYMNNDGNNKSASFLDSTDDLHEAIYMFQEVNKLSGEKLETFSSNEVEDNVHDNPQEYAIGFKRYRLFAIQSDNKVLIQSTDK